MKRVVKIISVALILVMMFNIKVIAHGGNITGWNDKESTEITEYNGKYYGYHEQKKVRHYHQVEWNEEEQKWQITKTAVYYDENFNIINTIDDSNDESIESRDNTSAFVGLIVIVILFIVAILFGKIKQKSKKENK